MKVHGSPFTAPKQTLGPMPAGAQVSVSTHRAPWQEHIFSQQPGGTCIH